MNFLSTLVRAEHLASQNPENPSRLTLYLTALDAVKTVLELGIERDRDTYLRHQFEFVVRAATSISITSAKHAS